MKKSIKCLTACVAIFLLLTSCGERGPVGPEGPPGPPGPEILPTSFEFPVDLLQSNGFEYYQGIPDQIEVFSSDMMLAYVLEDYIQEDDMDVWRQLPITDFTANGTRIFDYDFTLVDLRIFLDANYSLGPADEFEDVLMRAVHIPADFINAGNAKGIENSTTFEELEQILGMEIQGLKIEM